MDWIGSHLDDIWSLTLQHAWLSAVPTLLGLLVSLPLGWLARRWSWCYVPVVAGTGLLYTIPSLALFILMPLLLGTQVLDPVNVVVAMTIYTIALLTRTVADGLGSVPDDVVAAARAMGFGGVRRFFTVDLPLAVPVIGAGLRVAAVSNVSIVSVAALIGVQQLGSLFTDGFQRDFLDPIVAGVVGCVVLALVFDLLVVLATRLLTPWQRAGGRRAPDGDAAVETEVRA
ncbi:ABC transporter permease [Nocardioides marmoribigeumensis]|jgi:osmoprotectant transport system permease protein|uniref:Osmoprotectant transport system permease protein n=1 Tax=Nocardioides marmoribigeumensis TaxID=433649 RepID=A0ABU2BU86_9ACTN|nr:ABC transporter permease [Nocardioides marmoribigeumensis]MDR7362191.1 osmoprotectant transport system permease protein [Nocardioides marmoribigeumensis]